MEWPSPSHQQGRPRIRRVMDRHCSPLRARLRPMSPTRARELGSMLDPDVCAFCAHRKPQVRYLVLGPDGVAICDQCVFASVWILEEAGISRPPQGPETP